MTSERDDDHPKMTCPDCGETAYLLRPAASEEAETGGLAIYRCSECGARWDVVTDAEN